ncbi:MAG: penicillin-insensitive murein endopeptidase [Thermoanaerobaculia bacterium]
MTVPKKRERWLVRYMYVDPAGGERLLRDQSVLWATLSNGTTCFEPYFYGCQVSGTSWDYLDWWTSGVAVSCDLPLGAGYQTRIYYQYSRYSGSEPVPSGEDEWVPATVAATNAMLDQPGKLIAWNDGSDQWSSELRPGEHAFRVSLDRARINPSVPKRSISKKDPTVTNVGGDTRDQIDPGEARIVVDASECGDFYAGVHFAGTIDYVSGSGGHVHLDSHDTTPPTTYIATQQGTVSDAPSTFSGTTGSSGRWTSSPITAGTFAGAYDIKAHTDNLSPGSTVAVPRDAGPVRLTIGFANLVSLWTIFPSNAIISVGAENTPVVNCTSQQCDNHKDLSQYGHPDLLTFIQEVAARYRRDVDPNALLPVNDMSLPWGGAFEFPGDWQLKSHISHRIGIDFDVNASAVVNGVTYTINEADLDTVVVTKLKGLKIIEPTIHYRLPKKQIDAIVRSIK